MDKDKIIAILRVTPRQKARDIAKKLGADRSDINSILYNYPDLFIRDDDFRWSIKEDTMLRVEFPNSTWLNAESFEHSLKGAGCLLSSPCESVVFVVTKGCKILLEAAARFLALCNQLARMKKKVTIDFSSCRTTRSYFDRIGFLDQLDQRVIVLPSRPTISAATTYRGNSKAVVEFGAICIEDPNDSIPKLLKNQFVRHAGEKYSSAAFTIFSELFGNVCEHSRTPIPGFAALQKYDYPRPHIQTIVSDSGEGIVGTLRPILKEHYPSLAEKYEIDDPNSGPLLLKEVLEKGRITKTGCAEETGRGLGLKRSQEYAVRYNADISVRQETFELKLSYRDGKLTTWGRTISMPRIMGTHVCFDFFLD